MSGCGELAAELVAAIVEVSLSVGSSLGTGLCFLSPLVFCLGCDVCGVEVCWICCGLGCGSLGVELQGWGLAGVAEGCTLARVAEGQTVVSCLADMLPK